MAQPYSSRNKYSNVNTSGSYSKPSSLNSRAGSSRSGLVVLGRTTRLSVPKPINLPSLKKEHAGNDPRVPLVSGSSLGWSKQFEKSELNPPYQLNGNGNQEEIKKTAAAVVTMSVGPRSEIDPLKSQKFITQSGKNENNGRALKESSSVVSVRNEDFPTLQSSVRSSLPPRGRESGVKTEELASQVDTGKSMGKLNQLPFEALKSKFADSAEPKSLDLSEDHSSQLRQNHRQSSHPSERKGLADSEGNWRQRANAGNGGNSKLVRQLLGGEDRFNSSWTDDERAPLPVPSSSSKNADSRYKRSEKSNGSGRGLLLSPSGEADFFSSHDSFGGNQWGRFALGVEPPPSSFSLEAKLARRKKEEREEAEFREQERKKFEAELEMVRLQKEIEKQKQMADEQRIHDSLKEEKKLSVSVRSEQQKDRNSAEFEILPPTEWPSKPLAESSIKAEEDRKNIVDEKKRIAKDEAARKENARKKLLELEERIAKREAEHVAKLQSSALIKQQSDTEAVAIVSNSNDVKSEMLEDDSSDIHEAAQSQKWANSSHSNAPSGLRVDSAESADYSNVASKKDETISLQSSHSLPSNFSAGISNDVSQFGDSEQAIEITNQGLLHSLATQDLDSNEASVSLDNNASHLSLALLDSEFERNLNADDAWDEIKEELDSGKVEIPDFVPAKPGTVQKTTAEAASKTQEVHVAESASSWHESFLNRSQFSGSILIGSLELPLSFGDTEPRPPSPQPNFPVLRFGELDALPFPQLNSAYFLQTLSEKERPKLRNPAEESSETLAWEESAPVTSTSTEAEAHSQACSSTSGGNIHGASRVQVGLGTEAALNQREVKLGAVGDAHQGRQAKFVPARGRGFSNANGGYTRGRERGQGFIPRGSGGRGWGRGHPSEGNMDGFAYRGGRLGTRRGGFRRSEVGAMSERASAPVAQSQGPPLLPTPSKVAEPRWGEFQQPVRNESRAGTGIAAAAAAAENEAAAFSEEAVIAPSDGASASDFGKPFASHFTGDEQVVPPADSETVRGDSEPLPRPVAATTDSSEPIPTFSSSILSPSFPNPDSSLNVAVDLFPASSSQEEEVPSSSSRPPHGEYSSAEFAQPAASQGAAPEASQPATGDISGSSSSLQNHSSLTPDFGDKSIRSPSMHPLMASNRMRFDVPSASKVDSFSAMRLEPVDDSVSAEQPGMATVFATSSSSLEEAMDTDNKLTLSTAASQGPERSLPEPMSLAPTGHPHSHPRPMRPQPTFSAQHPFDMGPSNFHMPGNSPMWAPPQLQPFPDHFFSPEMYGPPPQEPFGGPPFFEQMEWRGGGLGMGRGDWGGPPGPPGGMGRHPHTPLPRHPSPQFAGRGVRPVAQFDSRLMPSQLQQFPSHGGVPQHGWQVPPFGQQQKGFGTQLGDMEQQPFPNSQQHRAGNFGDGAGAGGFPEGPFDMGQHLAQEQFGGSAWGPPRSNFQQQNNGSSGRGFAGGSRRNARVFKGGEILGNAAPWNQVVGAGRGTPLGTWGDPAFRGGDRAGPPARFPQRTEFKAVRDSGSGWGAAPAAIMDGGGSGKSLVEGPSSVAAEGGGEGEILGFVSSAADSGREDVAAMDEKEQ